MEYREYNIRKTTIDDLKEIKNILCLYFGKFPEKHGATDDIENKYMVGIQIISRADYNALETKSPKILYLVLETDGSISQYLCTTPANLIKFESLG